MYFKKQTPKNYHIIILGIAMLILSACQMQKDNKEEKDALASHIDSSIQPGQDFFLFANGKWFKENPIPSTEKQNGLWQLIQDTINAQIHHICTSSMALANAEKGSNKQKIGDFFFSGMDSVNINKKGKLALQADFNRIDSIKDINGVIRSAAYIQSVSSSPLFSFFVGQDDKFSSKHALYLWQGGLSLPDRSYYFDTDKRAADIREKFITHLGKMFEIIGYDQAKAENSAKQFMKLETALAQIASKKEDTRDPIKNYNKYTFTQLNTANPNLNWKLFFESAGLKQVDTVIVAQPAFFKALNTYLKTIALDDWKNYLKFHLLNGLANTLDDKTYQEHFYFYSTVLRGIQEPKPRWKRVVGQTDNLLGELIGQVYVSEYLPKGTKEKLMEIGNAIRLVYAERIKNLDWMSSATKEKALKKLNSIVMKVGYPDKWKDLSSMQIDRNSYTQNTMNANKWGFNYVMSKYGKPVDRTEWDMQPQNYNAYYNPSNNEIVVPACNIIVPGYERKMADDALLYSIIGGSTFGHEITHGFDDQGSKYNELGNLSNWWTTDDSIQFYGKTKKIVKQFNGFIAVDSLHVNGELTQGENIADLGGIMMGFEAFKKTNQFKNKEIIGGIKPEQRFFLGYALAWMINERPESIADQVRSNEHSPAKFRVLGPLANMPEFYSAFEIKENEAMYIKPGDRVQIW